MTTKLPFNYIITIHNKEELLGNVLNGIAECAGPDARIIPVLDGCTDGSEGIAKEFAKSSGIETVLAYAPDVHEIKAIGVGLQQIKPGYVAILQDDVVLQEPKFEDLVHGLCEEHDRRLGYISMRMAGNVRRTDLARQVVHSLRVRNSPLSGLIEICDLVSGPVDDAEAERVDYGKFVQRMVGIKSPVCLTPELITCEPRLDESLAPYTYDDVDMSLRALKRGLINGLYPLRFTSRIEWGGTRKDPGFRATFGQRVRLRNRRIMWEKHGDFVRESFKQYRKTG